MNAESTALAEERETCHEAKEKADIDLEFLFCIFFVLSRLFASFDFTSSRLVRDPFSEPTPKMGFVNFRLSFMAMFNWRLYLIISRKQLLLKPESSAHFCLMSEGGPYPLSPHSTPVQKISDHYFYGSFFINVVIHGWMTDIHSVPWLKSHRGQRAVSVDTLSAFSSYYFSSLSPSREISPTFFGGVLVV